MITVSTTSDTEAHAVVYALEECIAPELSYEVYLLGAVYARRAPGACAGER